MVYVTPQRMYVTAAYATRPLPSSDGGAENIRMRITALVMVPMRSQGRNLPHFVFVFATMIPMIGSLKASKILATSSMMPIAMALVFSMSWK